MKRKLVIAVVAATLVLFGTTAFAAQMELRIVGSWNSLTLFKNFEEPFWSEVVPQELGIKTSVTSLGQVGLRGAAVLRQMDMGVFDVVHTVIDYVVEDSPALAGLDLPALALDLELARKVVDAYIPVIDEYLAKDFNIKLLSVAPYPAQILFSRDRINSLSDLRGKKIRASGWTTAEFINAVGATGVTLNFSEVPQAMQRGVVDGAVTGSLSGYSAGWGEVSNFIYPLPIGGWDYVIGTISMTAWEKLSPEQQTKLQQLIKDRLETPAWEVTARETVEGIECLGGGACPHGEPGNLEILELSEADKARSTQILLENVLPAWAGKVPAEVVQKWNATIGEVVDMEAK